MLIKNSRLILLAAVCILTAGCAGGKELNSANNEKKGVIVETANVKSVPLPTAFEFSGTLEAFEERSLSFENGGRIASSEPEVGAFLAQGDTAARLDEAEYLLQIEQAEAAIQEAQANIENAEAGIQSAASSLESANALIISAQAKVDSVKKGARSQEIANAKASVEKAQGAYEKAKADTHRITQLLEAGAATTSEYENAQLNLVVAEKELDQANAAYSLLLEGATEEENQAAYAALKEAEAAKSSAIAAQTRAVSSKMQAAANLEKAYVAKREAELNLAKTRLTAPMEGVVLEKGVNTGELVSAGQMVYRIGNIKKLKALIPIPDSEVSNWKKGQAVHVSLYDQTRRAVISNIYPSTNANTGTINAEITIPNPSQDWMPGQIIKAVLEHAGEQGILVPAEAVIQTGNQSFVFKEANGKAVQTEVTLGERIIDNKYLITSGLQEGDRIVTKGADSLINGDTVESAKGGSE